MSLTVKTRPLLRDPLVNPRSTFVTGDGSGGGGSGKGSFTPGTRQVRDWDPAGTLTHDPLQGRAVPQLPNFMVDVDGGSLIELPTRVRHIAFGGRVTDPFGDYTKPARIAISNTGAAMFHARYTDETGWQLELDRSFAQANNWSIWQTRDAHTVRLGPADFVEPNMVQIGSLALEAGQYAIEIPKHAIHIIVPRGAKPRGSADTYLDPRTVPMLELLQDTIDPEAARYAAHIAVPRESFSWRALIRPGEPVRNPSFPFTIEVGKKPNTFAVSTARGTTLELVQGDRKIRKSFLGGWTLQPASYQFTLSGKDIRRTGTLDLQVARPADPRFANTAVGVHNARMILNTQFTDELAHVAVDLASGTLLKIARHADALGTGHAVIPASFDTSTQVFTLATDHLSGEFRQVGVTEPLSAVAETELQRIATFDRLLTEASWLTILKEG